MTKPENTNARHFIHRPIAVLLVSLGLFLTGVVAFLQLPIAPLPRIDFPTINVSARLPGADPETMAATVAAPLERRLGEIAGVTELTSSSGQGTASITAQFDLGRDIEGAARDVQAAINSSGSDLPVDLPNPPTYRKVNPADAPVLILAVTSKTLTPGKLYDACDSILVQRISQVDGVAQVGISGADKPAVRVQINPAALFASGLTMDEVRNTLSQSNANTPKGILQNDSQSMVIGTNDRMREAGDYAKTVLKTGDTGTSMVLSNIANVQEGVENSRQAGWFNLGPAIIIIIQKQADANVIETVDKIKEILPRLESWMPAGTEVSVLSDRTQTIRASVDDVEFTLLISIILVVLVVFFSLGRITPTVAASVAVPLSLAGTFAVMWLLGYSLNNISLMALIVSVGFVVDDAIVMIENIAKHVERGEHPITAAIKGAREITFTIISISISLVAVFIPLLFMGGIIGRMFREFAVTLTVAIVISAFVSVFVTPTLYAHLMVYRQRAGSRQHSFSWGEQCYSWLFKWYDKGLGRVMRHQTLMLCFMVATVALTVFLYIKVPKGFFPQQDTGMIMGSTQSSSDVSFQSMSEKQQNVTRIILEDPAVEAVGSSVGIGGGNASGNRGRLFISLKPLSERKISASAVIDRLRPKLSHIEGVQTVLQAAQDVRVGGRSGGAQFQFVLSSESLADLRAWTPKFIEQLRQEDGISDVNSDQDAAAEQVNVIIDRDRAARLGIDVQAVDNALQNAFAQRQISTIYTQRNQYHVILEIDPRYQQDPSALQHIYLSANNGEKIPLSALARFERGLAPLSITHQGQFPAATLSFNLPEGAALSDASDKIEQIGNKIGMPASIHTAFAGNAKAFADSLRDQPILIGAALLAIYIVLGVLYENTFHPITIISTLPSAGIGALLALMISGNELSLISVIGVILLMGIVKKNGIMLVDFAIVGERQGKTPQDAMLEACRQRFRPIVMTTIAAILGALPLIFAGGNGAELRQPLGIAIVGGLLLSQFLTLYTTPVVYLGLEGLRLRMHKKHKHEISLKAL